MPRVCNTLRIEENVALQYKCLLYRPESGSFIEESIRSHLYAESEKMSKRKKKRL